MYKKIIIFTIALLITNNTQSAQQQTKSSHYQLQYYKLYTTRPAHSFVEPIISCDINPSSMSIKHAEVNYLIYDNIERLRHITTTISLTPQAYSSLTHFLDRKETVYVEAHNKYRDYWQLFKIEPKRTDIKKIRT